ncbi:Threonylcarbamoyl-AMP synthase [bioreactor metagenome]|uniref:Threonylcarbamoyl-AMP synthase n=1 Tax=bioreactor metagenome TaxID=1076179 RepID=A0A644WHR4_9ZZZZ
MQTNCMLSLLFVLLHAVIIHDMATPSEITIAAQHIKEGKLVAFPTETVYGLGANALNPHAVARIFELKERPTFDPLIVHIASLEDISKLTATEDKRVSKLAARFWPGPLTIILPKSELVPDIVTSGLATVGIRMPNHPVALELIRQSGCPIAAPSANKFGQLSPTQAKHVSKQLPDVDFLLDGGEAQVGIESTIISLNEKGFEILRHGVITREEIETIVPFYAIPERDKTNIVSPGMLKSHYSPEKPIYLIDENLPAGIDKTKAGLLSFSGEDTANYQFVELLAPDKELKTCAVNLFAAIHRLEESNVEYILAETVPETGIGIAIMDKLRKAAYRYQKH